MPNIARRTIALAAVAVAIIAATVALNLPSAAAQSDDEQTGRIVARRLDDGRTEFGWQPSGGERVLPTLRYFPANVDHQRWLNSSPVEVGGEEIGRINVRLSEDGRIEFAFTPTDGERILPPSRYFPAAARPNRWLRSTEITISPPAPPPATGFIAVSAATVHTCALRESGEIECWGSNGYGETDAPAGRFTAVSTGQNYSCAIRESGEIACWGRNEYGETDAPAGSDFTAVSASGWHACAIRESGEITCWGRNDTGQTDAPAGSFSTVGEGGANNTCAIRESGEIACWGEGVFGMTDAPPGPFSAVSVGQWHTCGLRTTGEIECWGRNTTLARDESASAEWGDIWESVYLGQIDAPAGRFTAVSADNNYSCAIRESGEIACWGSNKAPPSVDGEGGYGGQTDAPAGRFTAVSAGGYHACAIRDDGAIECWGNNPYGLHDPPAP